MGLFAQISGKFPRNPDRCAGCYLLCISVPAEFATVRARSELNFPGQKISMLSKPIKYILPFALLITTALCALMFKISYIDSKGDLDFLLYNTPIPRIIHQSWKTHELPEKFLEWATSWKHKNPDFAYKLWNDTENRNLIVEHYPWFLHTYDSLPQNIHRVDASRLFYMHKYGGIYSDLDLECLQPM